VLPVAVAHVHAEHPQPPLPHSVWVFIEPVHVNVHTAHDAEYEPAVIVPAAWKNFMVSRRSRILRTGGSITSDMVTSENVDQPLRPNNLERQRYLVLGERSFALVRA
jgi:hypothetical protein